MAGSSHKKRTPRKNESSSSLVDENNKEPAAAATTPTTDNRPQEAITPSTTTSSTRSSTNKKSSRKRKSKENIHDDDHDGKETKEKLTSDEIISSIQNDQKTTTPSKPKTGSSSSGSNTSSRMSRSKREDKDKKTASAIVGDDETKLTRNDTPQKKPSSSTGSSSSKSKSKKIRRKTGTDSTGTPTTDDKEESVESELPQKKSRSDSTGSNTSSENKSRRSKRKASEDGTGTDTGNNSVEESAGKEASQKNPRSGRSRKSRRNGTTSIVAGNHNNNDNVVMEEEDVDMVSHGSKEEKPKKKDEITQATPTTTTLDVTVHRLRNLEYQPKPIVCLRATPSTTTLSSMDDHSKANPAATNTAGSSSLVALSREDGSIELKAPNEKFRTIAEIAGYKQKVVNCMAWTCGISSSPKKIDNKNIMGHHDTQEEPIDRNNNSNTTTDNIFTTTTSNMSSCRPTLVGGSRDGTLFIVDFSSGVLTGMTASGGGGVFALTSLCQRQAGQCCGCGVGHSSTTTSDYSAPHTTTRCAQLVAAGCEDGTIRIFKLQQKNAHLELVSILPSASGGSILSLAWRRRSSVTSNSKNGTVLFAGVSDGTIRRYDSESSSGGGGGGSWKSRLRMTVESLGRNTPTRVWSLQALASGMVVSGDSLGHVQFWDGDTGTLLQSFDQNDNKADVLEMAVSADECKVFASGVDSRVVCIERPSRIGAAVTANDEEQQRKWILSQAQRPHTHDVKAITICCQQIGEDSTDRRPFQLARGKSHEVLCTGGIDTKLCTYYVEGFKKLRPQSLYPWPAFSPVAQAKDARIIILRRAGKIDLYKLEDSRSSKKRAMGPYSTPDGETHIGTIELESPCNLVCATISDDGRYLAACDALSLFVFRIEYVGDSNRTSIIPSKLSVDAKHIKGSVVSLKFGGSEKLIAAASDGSIHIIDMPTDGDDSNSGCTLAMTLRQKNSKAQHKGSLFTVHSIEFSANKKWLAVLQSGYDCSSIRVFWCEDDEKTYRLWWSLPDLECPATAVRFLEFDNNAPQLLASCSNFGFYTFDVKQRQLSPWSEDSGVPISKHLPGELTSRNDYPVRITSNPASPGKILLGSFGAFALIDLDKKLPRYCRFVPEHHVRRWRKRKMSLSEIDKVATAKNPDDAEASICLRYNSILHMDFIAADEMVIVEQPWLSVIATFPAALERKIYGS